MHITPMVLPQAFVGICVQSLKKIGQKILKSEIGNKDLIEGRTDGCSNGSEGIYTYIYTLHLFWRIWRKQCMKNQLKNSIRILEHI